MNGKTSKNRLYYLKVSLLFLAIWGLLAFGIRIASGNNILGADYYTFYTAARMYLLEGKNPYSEEVTQMAQLGILGRLAHPDEDQLGFAYPIFMLFWVMPFAWLDISISQSLWMSLNLLLFLTCLYQIYKEQKSFIFIGLTFYPFCFGIILGNFSNLISVILLYSFYVLILSKEMLKPHHQIYIGFLLAWTIGKPQISLLLLIFALLICLKSHYFYTILAFCLSIMVFVIISWVLLPDWLSFWVGQLQKYAIYNQSTPAYLLSSIMSFTQIPSTFWSMVVMAGTILTFFVWLRIVYKPENIEISNLSYVNLLFFVLLSILSVFLMPRTLSYDQVLLILGLFIGSKPFISRVGLTLKILWIFLSAFSWLTFALPLPALSSTNVVFPFFFTTCWLIIFLLLYTKFKPKAIVNAPA